MFRINQLLLDLYSCPTGRGRWPVVLDQLCTAFQVESAVVQIIQPVKGQLRSRWMVRDSRSEAARAVHDTYFSDDVNPRMRVRRAYSAWQSITRDSDIFDPDDPLLTDLNTRLAAAGLGRYLGARTPIANDAALTLVLHRRPNDQRDFSKREENLALELLPHLQQAIQLAGTLFDAQRETHYLHETVDHLRLGLMTCTADASPHWSNSTAQRFLKRSEILWQNADRQLTTNSARQTIALRAAIARAAEDRNGVRDSQVLMLGNAGANALQVRVQALESTAMPMSVSFQGEPRALLVLIDPNSRPHLPADLLKQLFGLSPAESRLASALCFGSTLNEYATHAGVAVSTVRYQLKQIMAKMEVSKQSQLVQRLCTSIVFRMPA